MAEHHVKTWPSDFQAVWDGRMPFVVERNDDDRFSVDDILRLREWAPYAPWHDDCGQYTRREILATVTHILDGGQQGIAEGYCVLGIRLVACTAKMEI